MTLNILILAAGLGTRMKSEKPKVMHEILGKPIVEYILQTSEEMRPSRTILLISPKQDSIREYFNDRNLCFAVQERQLGTGDAVKSALCVVEENADLMVLAGDVPMIKAETLKRLYDTHVKEKNCITFLTMVLADPKGYGRVKRNGGKIEAIVEEKDASDEIKKIQEVNSGLYVFSHEFLFRSIASLTNENTQKEYYLTDLIKAAYKENAKTSAIVINDADEVSGINDRKQLSDIEQAMLTKRLSVLMLNGVTVRSPQTVYMDDSVKVEQGAEIGANVVLKGRTVIKERAVIGDFSYIKNHTVEKEMKIKPFTMLDE
ncbi:MAG: sugar phosphate nucleotidyltransferase [bacterium]